MSKIETLISISEYLGLGNIVAQLNAIEYRSQQENANLILPLVGEFSSGKTTLINALTDSKKLETATKPTTATIYEVHFGSKTCYAEVITEEGMVQNVDDIAELKNEKVADAKVISVYDTSNKIPSTTILADTPGLSSPNPKHKQTLVNFLPKADGIILVTDINQQITKSLTAFVDTMKLSKRPIYLVLTKSDTKSPSDIETAKQYIHENCQIPIQQIAVVSANNNDLDEFYVLIDSIQKNKKEILKQVDDQRIKNIIDLLTAHIEELMSASNSNKDLNDAIIRCQHELDKISRNIDRLVESMSDDIADIDRQVSRKFEDVIFTKLNTLVNGKNCNFDAEAISMINNTATILMHDYKSEIQGVLRAKARSNKGTDNDLSLSSLENFDMSSIQMSGLSYNLDLNTMGHEYDGWIKSGVIVVAAVGAVATVATTGGGAASVIPAVATMDNVIDLADTISDVSSIISNRSSVGRVERAVGFISQATEKYKELDESNQQMGRQMGSEKGMIDSMIGFVVDKAMSKPQRVRAIHNYIESSLAPEFKINLQKLSESLVQSIRDILQTEASILIELKKDSLNQLKQELKDKKNLFDQRMTQLREYKTTLLTL